MTQTGNDCLLFPDMTAATLEIPKGDITAVVVNSVTAASSEPLFMVDF
jgi:hypothetical protein